MDGKPYTVTRVDKGQRRRQPQPPFITSTLQQDASRALGFSATRTMRAAQRLYEGMEMHGYGQIGLITYMRTDSLRIADEAAAAAKTFIGKTWGENYVCNKKRVWKSRSATAAQDAHEAIRPSMPELTPDQVEGSISGDEAKLYRLIWSRFMASQMADCLMDTVSANITAGDYIFRASGFHITFDGFTALYEEATDDKQKKETALPPLEVSQDLKLNKLSAEQKFTQPPPYYTEATLIHALEENGIGRPSTYAPIITTIVDRGYVEKEQKKLKTTPLGRAVNQVMLEQFPDIVDPTFSADMEKSWTLWKPVKRTGSKQWTISTRALKRAWKPPKRTWRAKDQSGGYPHRRDLRKMRPPHGDQKRAVRQVCGVLRLSGVPQRPPHCKGYRRPVPAVRRPYAAAQKRQGPRVLRLQQLPHLQLYDMG